MMQNRTLAIIGAGLIGGSVAKAARMRGLVDRIVAYDRDQEALKAACQQGVFDEGASSIVECVSDCTAIVVAVPVCAMRSVFAEIAHVMPEHAWLTDVGSVRGAVIAAAEETLGERLPNYVPMHPIAGGEMPGFAYAKADLFVDKWCLSTPTKQSDPEAVAFWEDLFRQMGARVVRMSAIEHDAIFARVSHVPHLLAYSMMHGLLDSAYGQQAFPMAGAGFQDFTRIAASSPEMWADISLTNKDAILEALNEFEASVAKLRQAVVSRDRQALLNFFEKASTKRRAMKFPRRV